MVKDYPSKFTEDGILGNFLLLESNLNNGSGSRNWIGKEYSTGRGEQKKTHRVPYDKNMRIMSLTSVKGHDKKYWGKYHVYVQGEWVDPRGWNKI